MKWNQISFLSDSPIRICGDIRGLAGEATLCLFCLFFTPIPEGPKTGAPSPMGEGTGKVCEGEGDGERRSIAQSSWDILNTTV